MKPTVCPKCGANLESITHGGIEVDRCCNCKGIWFDSLEAEKLKRIKDSEHLDIGDPETGHQFDQIDDDVSCPRCGATMFRMIDLDRYSIWYEKCPQCHGVWLDAGEFKKFKQNFSRKRILGRVRKTWRPRPR
ncbi:MAG: zf-TFIIB domain-containing protein [Coleofasciculus sp. C1-SOL-03]|jgi:Zn-finger nucleic acid-binding protein|uniref:zf-TFIIB domain-containing protein n=1 Tax=Coleofasciculus sp. C1-SOL-03 TaxID=3069522 RepID=UPI0032F9B6DD